MPKLGSDASHSLPALQNLIKRDPASYADEFRRRWHHFQSVLALHQQNPAADSRELVTSVAFAAAVGPCYPELTVSLPSQLSALLEEQHSALDSTLRSALLQALILLRNRGMMAALELLQLCFRLFRCRDKALRAKVTAHIVADLKLVNLKRKDMALNKALQNYVITMLSDANAAAAKHSLMVMIQMYRRGIWRDAKTVNVVAGALFSPHTKLRVAALHFLLGAHDLAADAADSDEEEESARKGQRVAALRETIGKDGSSTKSLKCKKKRALKRASRSAAKASSKSSAGANANGAFAAIHLLHNPHDVAERLVSELRKSKDRFEVRLLMISLSSRLIGTHRLMLPAFYPFVMRYMQPHQRDVTTILAACVQAAHELVPPETLEPVLQTLVTHFVSDRSRPEVITVGINTVREICVRVPLAMDATLLDDLVGYRKDKDRGVIAAARGLLQVYRERMPELLHKKHRGRGCDVSAAPSAYGAVQVAEGVDGIELLAQREAKLAAKGRLRAQRADVQQLRGAKRKAAEAALDAEAFEAAEAHARHGAAIEGEAVDEMDIKGIQMKRAATREERLANTLAGREDRGTYGGGKSKKTGGKSNKEKKKNNPFMMARKSLAVRGKAKRREENARRAQRQSKKQFRGKVRK